MQLIEALPCSPHICVVCAVGVVGVLFVAVF